jgi:hypothetical protein
MIRWIISSSLVRNINVYKKSMHGHLLHLSASVGGET